MYWHYMLCTKHAGQNILRDTFINPTFVHIRSDKSCEERYGMDDVNFESCESRDHLCIEVNMAR